MPFRFHGYYSLLFGVFVRGRLNYLKAFASLDRCGLCERNIEMKRTTTLLFLLGVLILAAGCNIPRANPEQQQTATSLAFTQAALTNAPPATTLTPTPTLASGGPPSISTATPAPLSPTPPQFDPSTSVPPADAVVATASLRLRAGPSTAFPVLRTMSNGTLLAVTGKNGNFPQGSQQLWLRVSTVTGGVQGWTAGWLVTVNVNLASVPVVATPVPPTAIPTNTFTPEPSTDPVIRFWADSTQLLPGQCTKLHWNVENIQAVYLDGQPQVGEGEMEVCPAETFTSTLTVHLRDGTVTYATVVIDVLTEPAVDFRADRTQLAPGECTYVRWDVEGAQAVYFQGQGVVGHSQAQVCPGDDTEYHLRVVSFDGSQTYDYYQTIAVD